MATAMVSALTGHPVRRDLAMTGEISLRGRVLPIGGLKEKSLAALRGEIKQVLLPIENEKDLQDIPEQVRSALEFTPVRHLDQVLELALRPADGQPLFRSIPKDAPETDESGTAEEVPAPREH
jgi:ATP-dependent Lon protease